MNTRILIVLISLLSAAALRAEPRASASYSIPTDTVDSAGTRVTSASYSHLGSMGGITGLSTVAAPAETVKAGYLAQLYDITGLTITAASLTVNEGDTAQLAAWQALDDGTFLAVRVNSVAWSVAAGPLTGVDFRGLATAGLVFKDTTATVQGGYFGKTGTLDLTVVNVNIDDYGTYAGDGMDDNWQVRFFGLPPNTNAGPLIDPDGDGTNNLFEYTAGTDPTDPFSVFRLNIEAVPGQPTHKKLIFSPRFNDRTYTVKAATTLSVPMAAIFGPTSDNGNVRTVTDTNATGSRKFYKVEIVKP